MSRNGSSIDGPSKPILRTFGVWKGDIIRSGACDCPAGSVVRRADPRIDARWDSDFVEGPRRFSLRSPLRGAPATRKKLGQGLSFANTGLPSLPVDFIASGTAGSQKWPGYIIVMNDARPPDGPSGRRL